MPDEEYDELEEDAEVTYCRIHGTHVLTQSLLSMTYP